MRRAWAVGLAVWIVCGGAVAAGPARADPGKCAAIESNLDRLSCYDAAAKGAEPTAADQPKNSTAWGVSVKKSPMDDSTNVFLTALSEEDLPGRLGGPGPKAYLLVRCMERVTSYYIVWGDTFIGSDSTRVQYRLDDEKPKTEGVSISTDHKATGHFSGGRAIPFIKEMFGKKKLLVRVTPYSESPIAVTFDITGLEGAIKPLRQACKW